MGTGMQPTRSVSDIEVRRREIADEMLAMRSMARGSITEQHFTRPRKGKPDAVFGPYSVFSRREGNKTTSRRLRTPEELEQARQDVASHERFKALCAEFETLTEQLGQLERAQGPQEQVKKKSRQPSTKTRK